MLGPAYFIKKGAPPAVWKQTGKGMDPPSVKAWRVGGEKTDKRRSSVKGYRPEADSDT